MMSNKENKYINDQVSTRDVDEAAIYRDAWRIADPGASNPVAVAGTLAQASSALLHHIGTDGVRKHPALRLMAAQLAYLYNVNADGGGGLSGDDNNFIEEVKSYIDKHTNVCPTCGAYNDSPCIDQHDNAHGGKFNQTDHAGRSHTRERNFKTLPGKIQGKRSDADWERVADEYITPDA